LVCLLACACSAPTTAATVPDRPLPATFGPGESAPSQAATGWQAWVTDEALRKLIGTALADNPDVHIALQRVQAARAGVVTLSGSHLPQVGASVGLGLQRSAQYTPGGAGNAATEITPGQLTPDPVADFALGLQATWEIDLWGRLRHQRDAAAAELLASTEGARLVQTLLVADVAVAYFELLALDSVREVLREAAKRQQEALAIVRLQKEAGRANELAVQQFDAQVAETLAGERQVVQQGVEVENRIHVLLGRYPAPLQRDAQALFQRPVNAATPGVPSDLLRNRPDIREAEQRVQAAKFSLEAARAAFFPSLNLSAGLGLQAFNPAYLLKLPGSVTYSALGGLLAPLVNRRALQGQFEGAKASQIEAVYQYQKTVLGAFVEVAGALSSVQATEDVLVLKQAQKTATEGTVATAGILYRAGKATYLEVLVAQQNALRAELDLIEAWRLRRVADVVLYRALGGGWQ
jgi:NodT family efflux transporter outer membrane factor (OMF) lipoprotein